VNWDPAGRREAARSIFIPWFAERQADCHGLDNEFKRIR
jgi:hypothetical protein